MRRRGIVTTGMVATMGLIALMTGSPLAQASTPAAQNATASDYIVQAATSAAASTAVPTPAVPSWPNWVSSQPSTPASARLHY